MGPHHRTLLVFPRGMCSYDVDQYVSRSRRPKENPDTVHLVYKGSPQLNLDSMSPGKTAAAILLTGLVVSLLSVVFWVPYVRAKVIKKDYSE